MDTLTPEQLDAATIDLIFALRDSLGENSPSAIDFWGGRVTTALETAAAGADSAAQAVTIACRKLQIEVLSAGATPVMKRATDVIKKNFTQWATHVEESIVYIVALAYLERDKRKRGTKPAKTTNPIDSEEVPF